MRRFTAVGILALLIAIVASGCAKREAAPTPEPESKPNMNSGTPLRPGAVRPGDSSSNSTGGVSPMTSPGAGTSTPMSGTDSVAGSSSGSIGQAAKDQARRKAGSATPTGSEDSSEPGSEDN